MCIYCRRAQRAHEFDFSANSTRGQRAFEREFAQLLAANNAAADYQLDPLDPAGEYLENVRESDDYVHYKGILAYMKKLRKNTLHGKLEIPKEKDAWKRWCSKEREDCRTGDIRKISHYTNLIMAEKGYPWPPQGMCWGLTEDFEWILTEDYKDEELMDTSEG